MANRKEATEIKDLGRVLLRSGSASRAVNSVTLYRIVAFPFLILLIATDAPNLFKWLLLASFFTDAVDGFLARKYKVTSILGSKLDSVGDDLTVLAAAIALLVYQFDFVKDKATIFIVLFAMFLIQVSVSLYRYKKISTFHTYLAKIAAVVTAVFFLSVFFLDRVIYQLFYLAAAITALALIEEIALALILHEYRSNVKGLYWILHDNGRRKAGSLTEP